MYVGDDRIRDIFLAKEMGMKVAFYLSSLRECTQWRDFEDFVEKSREQDKVFEMGESFTRSTYARMLPREELALFFIYVLFRVAKLIFFERLHEVLQ